MSGNVDPKTKKKEKKDRKSSDTNNLVQFFEIVYVGMMLFLVFFSDFHLLNVHVFYSSVGWMLLMTQGLLVFHSINPVWKKLMGNDTIFIHWVVETIALLGATISFATSYKHKLDENKDHFTSWHGTFGLVGYILCIWSGLNGTLTLYRKELKNFILPQRLKLAHFITGSLGFFFGGLSLICSCYTRWFTTRTTSTLASFVIAIFLVLSVFSWTLIKPVQKTWRNFVKFYFNKESVSK